MRSELKIFKDIEEAVKFCLTLEDKTFGRLCYRPAMQDFGHYYLVRRDRRTGTLKSMSASKFEGLCKKYLA